MIMLMNRSVVLGAVGAVMALSVLASVEAFSPAFSSPASSPASGSGLETPLPGARTLTDAELAMYVGADNGTGGGTTRDCFPANGSCVTNGCNGPDDQICTTCVQGPNGFLCQNAPVQNCNSTKIINCKSGYKGHCINEECRRNTDPVEPIQCGVYFEGT